MPDIYIVDTLTPEAIAMLQALKSRSSEPAKYYVERCQVEGPDFMKKWYVGYGHGSIGQCATTTVFVEGVSILAAKAIQDNRLYNGQETSTRYVDYGTASMYDPLLTIESANVLQRWMDFYRKGLPKVIAHLTELNPCEDQPIAVYERTIKARAFDIMRGYLPCALNTQLSWMGSLENFSQQLLWLQSHPLIEVKQIAMTILTKLKQQYPCSFSRPYSVDELAYYSSIGHYYDYIPDQYTLTPTFSHNIDVPTMCDREHIALTQRPKHARLPRTLCTYGTFTSRFTLDYGSYRDIQRHRGGRCEMAIVTPDYGFHPWYVESLPDELQQEALELIAAQTRVIQTISNLYGEATAQYFCALGYQVAVELEYDLPQLVYVAELRSGQTVHPTLRKVAIDMLKVVGDLAPCIRLYGDTSPTTLTYKRGTQTIIPT